MAKKKAVPSKNGKPVANKQRSERLQILNRLVGNSSQLRSRLAKFMADSACHNVDAACDYPPTLSFDHYHAMYEREGIATRVVNIFPIETWTVQPWVYESESVEEDEQTEFEIAWKELATRLNINKVWAQLDEVSGIGHYGVMLIGTDDGRPLSTPLPGIDENGDFVEGEFQPRNITYLSVFNEAQAPISDWNRDQNSKRFGHPMFYNLMIADPAQQQQSEGGTFRMTAPDDAKFGKSHKVHWSRVIHVADNCRTSTIFGTPRMKNVFNYLMNLRRILGGSAEMFWNGGFPGTSFEVPPEIADQVDLDTEGLEAEIEDYFSGFKRYLALKGVTAKQLVSEIADPTSAFDVQVTAICVAIGVPKRQFMGTEEARLASIQDKDTWNRKVHRRNNIHVTPVIVRPTVDRFMAIRALPRPKEQYFVLWPDVYAISETDKADVTGKLVKAIAEYIKSGSFKLVPPLEFFTMFMDMTPQEAKMLVESAIDANDDGKMDFLDDMMEMQMGVGEEFEEGKALDEPSGKQTRILNAMPSVMRCMANGSPGYKYGQSGRCYTYAKGDSTSQLKARRKAKLQGMIKEATRMLRNMESADETPDTEILPST